MIIISRLAIKSFILWLVLYLLYFDVEDIS